MKNVIFSILVSLFLVSCFGKSKSKQDKPVRSAVKLAAIITNPDGSKDLSGAYLVIRVDTAKDVNGRDVILSDTLRVGPTISFDIDTATKKQKLDSVGKPVIVVKWNKILHKDSVNFNIAGKSLDSLLRPDKKTN